MLRELLGITSELVGRESEPSKLQEAYELTELTESGGGQLACVVGDAGWARAGWYLSFGGRSRYGQL